MLYGIEIAIAKLLMDQFAGLSPRHLSISNH